MTATNSKIHPLSIVLLFKAQMTDDKICQTVNRAHLQVQRPIFLILQQRFQPTQGTVSDISVITRKGQENKGRNCQFPLYSIPRASIQF